MMQSRWSIWQCPDCFELLDRWKGQVPGAHGRCYACEDVIAKRKEKERAQAEVDNDWNALLM